MSDETSGPTPLDSKLTTSKQRWAQEGRFLTGTPARAASERLPPGQHLVTDWPVLDLGQQPDVPLETWALVIDGAVEWPTRWTWPQFLARPQVTRQSDIHCVTTWSRYDNRWDGVTTRDLMAEVSPSVEARFVVLHGYDGYTTNLPIEDFATEDALLAHRWQGEPLSRKHGGPMRLIVPHLYLWKSAKWLKRVEFSLADRPGFWEVRGYHNRGDPWTEQRYSDD